MTAPRMNAKLMVGRNRANNPRNQIGPLELDPGKLVQITLNRDAIQALTIAQAKVQVSISAGGTTAILVSEETGKQIGGLDDLTKLTSLRSFVAREKKQTASSESQEQAMLTAFRAHLAKKESDPSFTQQKLDNSYVVATKPYRTMLATLDGLQTRIKDNYGTEHTQEDKVLLANYALGVTKCIEATVAFMATGTKEKGLLDQLLFNEGIPVFIKNKLTMKSLVVTKDMDLTRVLFPSDPSKGLWLTTKEWRDEAFTRKCGPLLSNSKVILKIIQNEALFLELTGLSQEQLSNAEDPKTQRVLKQHIFVVPPFGNHDRVLNLLAKQNFRGFGLPQTAMDQSKDRLMNVCAVPLRAYAFSIRMAENLTDFWDRVFPKGTIKSPDDKLGNYAKQALDAIEGGKVCTVTSILKLEQNAGYAIMAWIHRECKIIPSGELSGKIAKALGYDKDLGVPINDTAYTGGYGKPTGRILVMKPITTAAEKEAFKTFSKETFAIKQKSAKKRGLPAASVLLNETKSFLKEIKKEHSALLAESMESYFRGFYSESIQRSAVRIARARFDELEEEVPSTEDDSGPEGTEDEDDSE